MKKTTTIVLRFGLYLSLMGGLALQSMAQSDAKEPNAGSPNQMRVKITERNGDDSRVIERTYRSDGMTDEKRDALVNKLIDSLRAARKGKGNDSNISVIIEDSYRGPAKGNKRGNGRERVGEDTYVEGYGMVTPPIPPVAPIAPFPNVDMNFRFEMDDDSMPGRRRMREFRMERRHLDSLSRAMNRMGRDLNRQLAPMADRMNRTFRSPEWQRQFARPFNAWADGGQASTVRGLDVFPNNPDRHLLNVRFNAPAKGDVQITVTNTKGKEVARRELKDFSGEFVGQVDLGRKAEGVFFVTVTQNDDGAVRRVVLKAPKEESVR